MTSVRLTRRDRMLLALLCRKLRCVAACQLLGGALRQGRATTKSRLQKLVRAGFLGRAVVVAGIPELDGPLVTWRPGENMPVLSSVVTVLRRRDREAKASRTSIYWATEQAVSVVGGRGGVPRQPLQVQHDLGVAEVYFTRQLLDEETNRQWISEDIFRELNAGTKTKVPDAVLLSRTGKPVLAIEFGGAYSAARLKKFHGFCHFQNLPYEIW